MTPAAALSGANGGPCRRAEQKWCSQATATGEVRFSKWCARATGIHTGGSSFCEMLLAGNRYPDGREFVLRNGVRAQQPPGPAGVRFAKWCSRATGIRTGGSSFCEMVSAGNRHPDGREFVFRNGASSLKIQIPYKVPGGERPVRRRRSRRAARSRESRSQPAASRARRSPIIIAPERARTTHKHIKSCCGKRHRSKQARGAFRRSFVSPGEFEPNFGRDARCRG
jgi:hypothetical protein